MQPKTVIRRKSYVCNTAQHPPKNFIKTWELVYWQMCTVYVGVLVSGFEYGFFLLFSPCGSVFVPFICYQVWLAKKRSSKTDGLVT